MSEFRDSISEFTVASNKDEFENDEDVEYIEPADCAKRLKGLLIRVLISLFFISCCTGALIWSFVQGESGTSTHNETHRDASKNFSIYIDQYSEREGLFILTYKNPDDYSAPKVEEHQSFWIQSDTNKSLVHQITPNMTIYAFQFHSYWYDTSGDQPNCIFDKNTTYFDYINNLGMNSLRRLHSEYEETHNHKKVFVYQGNPNEVLLSNVQQNAFLVTAYADATTGALLAWDTYFAANNDSTDLVYKASYEYGSMISAKPDDTYFITPSECSPV